MDKDNYKFQILMTDAEKKRLALYRDMGTMNREQYEDYFQLRKMEEKEMSKKPMKEPEKVVAPVKKVVKKKK